MRYPKALASIAKRRINQNRLLELGRSALSSDIQRII